MSTRQPGPRWLESASDCRRFPGIRSRSSLATSGKVKDSAPAVDAFRLVNASTVYSSCISAVADREAMLTSERKQNTDRCGDPVVQEEGGNALCRMTTELPGKLSLPRRQFKSPQCEAQASAVTPVRTTLDKQSGPRLTIIDSRQEEPTSIAVFATASSIPLHSASSSTTGRKETRIEKAFLQVPESSASREILPCSEGDKMGSSDGPTRTFSVSAIRRRHKAFREEWGQPSRKDVDAGRRNNSAERDLGTGRAPRVGCTQESSVRRMLNILRTLPNLAATSKRDQGTLREARYVKPGGPSVCRISCTSSSSVAGAVELLRRVGKF